MVSYEMAHFSSSNTHAQRDRQIDKKKRKKRERECRRIRTSQIYCTLGHVKGMMLSIDTSICHFHSRYKHNIGTHLRQTYIVILRVLQFLLLVPLLNALGVIDSFHLLYFHLFDIALRLKTSTTRLNHIETSLWQTDCMWLTVNHAG